MSDSLTVIRQNFPKHLKIFFEKPIIVDMMTHFKKMFMLAFLASCGSEPGTKGFFTDANVCKPVPLPEDNPIDFLSGNIAIPIPSLGETRSAQLTTAETEKKTVWGAELFLSSTEALSGKLNVSILTKRASFLIGEVSTLGPDGAAAGQVFFEPFQTFYATVEPSWVRVQFPGTIELDPGDSVWLMASPDASQSKTVSWWYEPGSGAYFAATGTPLFIPIPGVKAVHRLIYCE